MYVPCVRVQLYCQHDAGAASRGAVELALQSTDTSSSAAAATLSST